MKKMLLFACFVFTMSLTHAQLSQSRIMIRGGALPGQEKTANTESAGSEKVQVGGYGGLALEIPLRTRFVSVAPEVYYRQRNQKVQYKTANGLLSGVQSGNVQTNYVGLSLPLQINLVSKKGTGIRFSGGVYTDYATNSAIKGSTGSYLALNEVRENIDFGWNGSVQLLTFNAFNFQLGYSQGMREIQYLTSNSATPNNAWKNSGFNFSVGVLLGSSK